MIPWIWTRQPGDYFFISTKSGTGEWRDHAFSRKVMLREVPKFLKANTDKDLYWGVCGFNQAKRRVENVCMPHWLWADMDEVDPRKCKLKPSIAIESSPGRFVGIWRIDREVTLDLNKRLTYFLGCDRSGYDLTQVVRIPGTTNYKYASHPRVRLLWTEEEGEDYTFAQLDKLLPKLEEREREDVILPRELPSIEIGQLSRDIRSHLKACRLMPDKSQRLTMIARLMVKEGYDIGEIAAVLMMPGHPVSEHVWTQKDQRRAVARAIGSVIGEARPAPEPVMNGYKYFSRSLAEVNEEDTEWLWWPYLVRGEISILEGDPGTNKTWLMQMVAKSFCDGYPRLPSERPMRPQKGVVFYATTENRATTVVKKRMRWLGLRNEENFYQEEQAFDMGDKHCREKIYEVMEARRPVLAVFDPITLYMGSTDIFRANEVTETLNFFVDIARRFNCAVVIVRHLAKGERDKALYRGIGSIAFSGVVHGSVMLCREDPDGDVDEDRLLLNLKVGDDKRAKPLRFHLTPQPTLQEPSRAMIKWGDFVERDTEEMAAAKPAKGESLEFAKNFIKRILASGEMPCRDIETESEKQNISHATLKRAARALGVVTKDSPHDKRQTIWSLKT